MKPRIKLEWYDNRWCVAPYKEKDSNIWWWPIVPADLFCTYFNLLTIDEG